MTDLASRWITEARRHESAADEIHQRDNDVTVMDEEQTIHLEIARTLRNCARELSTRI